MERDFRIIQPGTRVYSSDEQHVGDIEAVALNHLLVRKGFFFSKERYIPFDAVGRIEQDGVFLTVAKAQLDTMAWDAPPPETAVASTTPSNIDLAAFKEGTFEVRAAYSEVVVEKRARVVEEIVLKKDVTERVETIQGTVRRTRVDVEDLAGRTSSTNVLPDVDPNKPR